MTDAWNRLLATFRAVYGGVRHDRLTLIAYGGSLFDPDRFPFLEGRIEDSIQVLNSILDNNKKVLEQVKAKRSQLQEKLEGTEKERHQIFTQMGIDVTAKKMILVKSTQHFYAGFAPIATEIIYVATPGAITPNFAAIPYRKFSGPYWPRNPGPFT